MSYKKIDANSANSISSALDLFSTPPTNVSVASSRYQEVLTSNPVDSPPFHFRINAGSNYVDLSKCFLITEMKIQKESDDGVLSNPGNTAEVASIQGLGSTFIRNMRIMVNGRETFNANSLYSYKAYLDTELSYPAAVKDSYLSVMGWHSYAANQIDKDDVGFKRSRELMKNGGVTQFIAPIHADLFAQSRYLVSNVEIDVEITPHDNAFPLIKGDAGDANTYRLIITSCKLYIKTLTLTDGLALSIAKQMQTLQARYPIKKAELKPDFISAGTYERTTTLFTENLPRRLIIAFVDSDSYNGTGTSSPFNFKPFGIKQISVTANGCSYPNVPYNLRWAGNRFCRAYHDMQEGVGLGLASESNGITMDKYKDGWTIFVFNLSSSQENDGAFDLIKTGTTSVNVKFNHEVPAKGIYMIVYGESDSLLLLDANRMLTTDTTV